ncbi:flagellar biosynthetic protein FliQ [Brevibacillus laterosporus GI-9]|nr:flagellar biosynthetic protein FliQ [Brevibacillus laterosporus GI-9]
MILQIAQSSVYTILIVLAPILGIALLVGLMVSIFQATTQIQEQTLAFIPKIVAVFLSLLIFGPWMLRIVIEFTANIMGNLYRFVG